MQKVASELIERNRTDRGNLQEALQAKDKEIARLKGVETGHKARIEEYKHLDAKLKQYDIVIKKLKDESLQQKETIESLKEACKPTRRLEDQIKIRDEQLEELRLKIQTMEKDNEEAIKEVLLKEREKYLKACERFQEEKKLRLEKIWEIEVLTDERNKNDWFINTKLEERKNKRLVEENQAKTTEIEELKNRVDKLTEENCDLKSKYDKADKACKMYIERLTRMDYDNEKMRYEREVCESMYEHRYKPEIKHLKAEVDIKTKAFKNMTAKNRKLDEKCRELVSTIQSVERSHEELKKSVATQVPRTILLKEKVNRLMKHISLRNKVAPMVIDLTVYQDALLKTSGLEEENAILKKKLKMTESELRVKTSKVKPKVQCWTKAECSEAVEISCRGTRIPALTPKPYSPGSPPSDQMPSVTWQNNYILPGVPENF